MKNCISSLIFCLSVMSQQYIFDHYTSNDALVSNVTYHSHQDKYGFIWIACENGVSRFDGKMTRNFLHDEKNKHSLSGLFVNSIAETNDALWLATMGGISLIYFNNFQVDRLNEKAFKKEFFHQLFYHRETDRIYALSDKAIWLIDPHKKTAKRLMQSNFFSELYYFNGLNLVDTINNNILFGTQHAVYQFQLADSRFVHHPLPDNEMELRSLKVIDDKIFIASNKGIFVYHHGKIIKWNVHAEDLVDIVKDKFNRYWISSNSSGLILFENNRTHFLQSTILGSVSSKNLSTLMIDKEDNLWVSSRDDGIFKLNLNTTFFQSFIADNKAQQAKNVRSFNLFNSKEIILNNQENAIEIFDFLDKKLRQFPKIKDQVNYVNQSVVTTDYLIYASKSGLFQTHLKSNKVDRIDIQPANHSDNAVYSIYLDRNDTLWYGKNQKLFYSNINKLSFKELKFKVVQSVKGQISINENLEGVFRYFYEDSKDNLWIGAWNGGLYRVNHRDSILFRYSVLSDTLNYLSNNNVVHINESLDNDLWVSTYGGGISIYRNYEFYRHLDTKDKLASNYIYSVLFTKDSSVWISSNNGLHRMTGSKLIHYNKHDGLPVNEYIAGSALSVHDSLLFFGNTVGFTMINLNHIPQTKAFKQDIFIKNIYNLNTSIFSNDSNFNRLSRIELEPDQNAISVQFELPFYNKNRNYQIALKVNKQNADWLFLSNRETSDISQLVYGSNRLEYAVFIQDQLASEIKHFEIYLNRPFYLSWFMIPIYLAVLYLFYLLLQWLIRNWHIILSPKSKFIAHYKLSHVIGMGAMGTVYQALDVNKKQPVALKVINFMETSHADSYKIFIKESEIGARLSHKNIVTVYESGTYEQQRYLAMELLDGITLKQYIEENALSDDQIQWVAQQICSALTYIHNHDIIHRDIKSSNIMLDTKMEMLKLMDFGLASSRLLASISDRSKLVGTLAYMSPEQSLGKKVDKRSDIYALGVVLYEICYRTLPYHAENEMEMMYILHNEEIKEKCNPDNRFTHIISKATAKKPEDRYQSAEEIVIDLDNL